MTYKQLLARQQLQNDIKITAFEMINEGLVGCKFFYAL